MLYGLVEGNIGIVIVFYIVLKHNWKLQVIWVDFMELVVFGTVYYWGVRIKDHIIWILCLGKSLSATMFCENMKICLYFYNSFSYISRRGIQDFLHKFQAIPMCLFKINFLLN